MTWQKLSQNLKKKLFTNSVQTVVRYNHLLTNFIGASKWGKKFKAEGVGEEIYPVKFCTFNTISANTDELSTW